ncbi:MAG: MATE family efflux transporter [Sterolibacterium sp.]|nr:MATE family efflux transporter [Sterolibacterium sp.]
MSNRRSLLRNLFHLAWPVLIAQLAVTANGVIDTVMAGRLSPVDLAAVGIGASIYVTVFITAMGVLLALTPCVAHLYGGRQYADIGEEVRQSVWLSLLLSVFVIVLLRNPDPFLALSRLTPEVELKVRAYLDAISWSAVPSQLFRVFYGFSNGISKPRPIMIFNLIGVTLKVPLNLLFIYGYFGVPALGGPGCAVSTAIIGWLTCLMAWVWCARAEEYRPYRIFADFSGPKWAKLVELLKLGLPIGATFLVDVTGFTFMALFIARLGPATSGAHQVASNLAALAFMLPVSLGNAASVLVGQALGAGDGRGARRAGLAGIGIGLGSGALVSLSLWFGAAAIAGFYTNHAEVREAATLLIGYVAVYHLFDSLQGVGLSILRGYKKTTVPMAIYAVALWGVGLGGGYLLGLTDTFGPPRGAAGFWFAAILSLALAGGLVTAYFLKVSWVRTR